MSLPNSAPRPEEELSELKRVWQPPSGFRFITAINNSYIGLFYIGGAFMFFLLAGILALLIRTQLAMPENDFLGETLYNQIFTTHGTMMMFLFAVPAVEAIGILLLPNMLGARDLPFPKLSAYAFWAYFVGGTIFFSSLFFGLAPEGGWFMYPPLTSYEFSPGINADFWLLGIGFIEISAIAGAIEIAVGILRTRAPGLTLDRLPIFAWSMLVFAFMVIFAFPALIVGTILLELERAFHWPFFIADKGGDPLLWQHLFWFFGHPEVYIIFLPAAGMVSMIVPTMAQTPLVAYRLVVLALIATGFLSFGLWVHHMFTTGMPKLSLSFFSAASMAVAVPSGIQVFAWIATIANGRMRLNAASLFILGFLFIFTLGGLTGVMVAMVPFDWQVHDTYFVVAHFHYVLIGGMVFPLFAAFYYWAPFASRTPLSERLGKWAFAFIFLGVNVTFFPMHIMGLMGMPRRVYTYPAELGWGDLNLMASAGAYLIGIGVLVFLVDLARNFRPIGAKNAGNIWNAGTLEWLPTANYGVRSVPIVTSREPLWDQPNLSEDVEAGRYYLPGTVTGKRETLVTSTIRAEPQYILQLPMPGWGPMIAAIFTAAFFILLTFKLVVVAIACGVFAIAALIYWGWSLDPGPTRPPADIGGGLTLPVYAAGPASHAWMSMALFLCVAAAAFGSMVFTYLFLWTVNPGNWPPAGTEAPALVRLAGVIALYLASSAAVFLGGRALRSNGLLSLVLTLCVAVLLTAGAWGLDLFTQWSLGLRPTDHSYSASVFGVLSLQGVLTLVAIFFALFTIARIAVGRLDAARRNIFDMTVLLWHYVVLQGVLGALLVHLFPRFIG